MKTLHLLPVLGLALLVSPCFGQRVALTGGYQYLGQEAFRGVPMVGINVLLPVGQHVTVGLLTTAGRARQVQPFYIWNFGGGRTVDRVHNHYMTAEILLGCHFDLTQRLGLVVGPTLGLAAVGRREQSTSTKAMGGLWAGATYRNILGGRFNLEAAVHPQQLAQGPEEEDGNSTFAAISPRVLGVQAGVSYNLRK